MGGILDKATQSYSLKDVEEDKVEVRSVLGVDELERLIEDQVAERSADLSARVKELEARLREAEQGGDGSLERDAAEAALQAEANALEAKAAAEMRAEQAEAMVSELTAKLKEAQADGAGGGGEDGEAERLRARVSELEEEVAEARRQAGDAEETERLRSRVSELEGQLEQALADAASAREEADDARREAESAQASEDEPVEPVTEQDHSHAQRLARALLEDVVDEGEEKAKEALASGAFRETFAAQLRTAYDDYRRRVRPAVRAERDHWEEALAALHESPG